METGCRDRTCLLTGQLGERAASILKMALVIPVFQPCGEAVDSDTEKYQHHALNDHDEFVHSRSISRAMAAYSK